ncbi:alkyl/aryl-sulfatase [Shewanella waksmanii]|uniref:alkyl/aryl-sulfatase n=1 Tax=Shewanella waksmanii TaxID=213783 RepID=UPI0004B781D4|nr:alkyl sulfatase dimerization domain-containing protein [Shewanella waksmanii]
MNRILVATLVSATTISAQAAQHEHAEHHHHDHEHVNSSQLMKGKGKAATPHTIKANSEFTKTLNFNDIEVFKNNERGLIKTFDEQQSRHLHHRFDSLHTGLKSHNLAPDTVNSSLWRQAQANFAANGLYEVKQDIYQVRGIDLASTTFIRSDSGWIVYDVLMHDKAMSDAMDFFFKHVPQGGDKPIIAMLYSHSHVDHFGGSRAVLERFPDVKAYAPHEFLSEAISENVLAGNAMSRRGNIQYGATLGQASATGAVDAALANGFSAGPSHMVTLVPPHETFPAGDIEKFHERHIDGVQFVFMDTAGTEAPSGNVAYLPEHQTLWTGEMVYQGMHNIYTLRGAKVRDALKWSKDINEMINAWGGDVEYLMGSHSAPIWDNTNIVPYLEAQRDNYGFIHNQTLRLANSGMGIQDIGAKIDAELPDSLRKLWHTNGYHGTYSHNARAVYNMYLGYFDMNPANLNRLSVNEEANLFTQAYGGCQAGYKTAKQHFDNGNYRFAGVMLDHIVRACNDFSPARMLLADNWEQQGYQAEGAGWRNTFLTGAQEVRIGTVTTGSAKTASVDMLANMTVGQILDYTAIRVVANQADGNDFSINIVLPDINEKYRVDMRHGNLSNIKVKTLRDADATLTIDRSSVTKMMLGEASIESLIKAGSATLEGSKKPLKTLKNATVEFDPFFEVMPRPDSGKEVDKTIYQ